jgi:plastocyanin
MKKAAGEALRPSKGFTGAVSSGRLACAPGLMALSFYRRPAPQHRRSIAMWCHISKRQRRFMIRPILIRRPRFVLLAACTSVFILLATLTSADAVHAVKPQTFTVLVGAEDTSVGATVLAYFPDTVSIHVGDTVHWKRNSNEIHTVSFLAGTPLPNDLIPAPPGLPSPLMLNPVVTTPVAPANGQYDGTTFANSGVLGPDPGQYQSFDLTFTKPGTYSYLCSIHGNIMSGNIIVLPLHKHISSPKEVEREAKRLIAQAMADVPAAIAGANQQVPPPIQSPDGTTTYNVLVGYCFNLLEITAFFPNKLTVHPGDTVAWSLSNVDMAPHTITFLNGNPGANLGLPLPNGVILVNPDVLNPQNAGQPLTNQGIFSSGILSPFIGPGGIPTTSFSLQIGPISGQQPYECLIHDTNGMKGVLNIVPR